MKQSNIISECNKLAKKDYKTRHDFSLSLSLYIYIYIWLGKLIHWELCKMFKFDKKNKWETHNSELVL